MKIRDKLSELDRKLAQKYAVPAAVVLAIESLILAGMVIFLLAHLP